MSELDSPYIVKMEEVYKNAETLYIIIEFCEGGDLRQFMMNRNNRLEEI